MSNMIVNYKYYRAIDDSDRAALRATTPWRSLKADGVKLYCIGTVAVGWGTARRLATVRNAEGVEFTALIK